MDFTIPKTESYAPQQEISLWGRGLIIPCRAEVGAVVSCLISGVSISNDAPLRNVKASSFYAVEAAYSRPRSSVAVFAGNLPHCDHDLETAGSLKRVHLVY